MVRGDLKISLLQADLVWENPSENRRLLSQKMAHLQGRQQVLVLPEMFSTGFSMDAKRLAEKMDGPSLQWMREQAAKLRSIITGSIIIEAEGQYYNRLLWVLPNGEVAHYDKRHLFSYAGEQEQFSAGAKRVIAQVNGWKICLNICYDLRFPVWSRNTEAYDVLLYVANWPEKRNEIWETLLKARAIENMSFVIGVNRVGIDGNAHQYIGNSSIYDPVGQLLCKETGKECILSHSLQHQLITESRTRFGFLNDRDDFLLR